MPAAKRKSLTLLEEDYKSRKRRNSRYSMRSYGVLLGISSGRLSEIFCGKSPVTSKQAIKIVERAGWPEERCLTFLSLVKEEERELRQKRHLEKQKRHRALSLDEFALVADWEHFAVLSLLETKEARPNIKWIAKRLSLTPGKTQEVVERLIRYGYLNKEGDGFSLSQEATYTPSDIYSKALRESHKQTMQLAVEKLETVPLERRDVTSVTMAIDSKKLPEAKRLIQDFRKKMMKFLERGHQDEVYLMNVQLVPLTGDDHV